MTTPNEDPDPPASISKQEDPPNKELGLNPSSSTEVSRSDTIDNNSQRNDNLNIFQRFTKYVCSADGKELMVVVVITLITLTLSFTTFKDPLDRPIPYQMVNGTYVLDLTLDQHSEGDSISDMLVALLACVACPILQFLLTFVNKANRWIDGHRTVCVYLLTLAVNDCLTFMLKSYMGVLRPNFYEECQPNESYEYCTVTDGLMGIPYFAGSFPSGHASYTFGCLTLLYLYLEQNFGISSVQQAKVVVLEGGTTRVGMEHACKRPLLYRLLSIGFGLLLVLGLFMVASRIVDNQHHPADIIAGTLMGVCIAFFFHTMWFPDPRFVRLDETPAYAR